MRRAASGLAICAAVGIALAPAVTLAAPVTWTGASNGDWFTPGNWDTNTVPGGGDNVIVDPTSLYPQLSNNTAFINALTVGNTALARLEIDSNGVLDVSGNAVLGASPAAGGKIDVEGVGSVFNVDGELVVGEAGTGNLLAVYSGAKATAYDAFIGYDSGVDGDATVDGGGSKLTITHDLYIGRGGISTVYVENGATLDAASGTTDLGLLATGQGNIFVNDMGSTFNAGTSLIVGDAGYGSIGLNSGGVMNSGNATLGLQTDSTGLAYIDGAGSQWVATAGTLTVGDAGYGVLKITNGGSVLAGDAVVAAQAKSHGFATVDGQGSSLSTQNLTLGYMTGGNANLTLSNGAALTVINSFTIASQVGSTGTLNIGNSSGLSAQAPGTVSAPGIVFGDGDGVIVFNHTSSNYAFSTPIAGFGTLVQENGTTILDGNDAGFTGHTQVTGGTLLVDNNLGSDVLVKTGGTLGGSGTVGTVAIESGGTIAPGGNVSGTLHITGDFTQQPGSTYQLDLAPVGSDLITVTGTADIQGGTVYADKATGVYAPGTHYTILTADGGVTGTYDTLDQNAPFVDLSLHYDAHDVYLDVAYNNAQFCDVAITRNQCATGNGAQSLGAGSTVFDVLTGQTTDAAARHALDLLSGEMHASLRGALVEDGAIVSDLVTQRIRSAFGGVAAEGMPVLAYGEDGVDNDATAAIGGELAPADTGRLAAWGSAFGEWGHIEGDGNAAGLSTSTGGFLTGIDGKVGDDWRLGVVTGYSHNSFNDSERASSGDAKSYHLGVYGGTHWDVAGGSLGFRAGAAYSWHDISTSRDVVFPGMAENLTADYDAGATQLFGELGYDIKAGQVALEPFAGLAYVGLHTDGFSEKGGAAALTGASANDDVTFTTLGFRASEDFTLGGMTATARGTLGWRHAFGDTTPLASFSFAGSDAFTIAGAPIGKDAALVEAGFDVALTPQATLGFDYRGQLASKASENGFDANLAVRF